MSSALVCDNCGKVATGETDVSKWFRLERQGIDLIPEMGHFGVNVMPAVFQNNVEVNVDTDDEGLLPELPLIEQTEDDLTPVTLHYCKAACLAAWSAQAAALEPEEN